MFSTLNSEINRSHLSEVRVEIKRINFENFEMITQNYQRKEGRKEGRKADIPINNSL
jgi:hypothetical protein